MSNHKWLSFIAFTLFSGVAFAIAIKCGLWLGIALPALSILQIIILGNINTYAFALFALLIERTMFKNE